MSNEMKRLTAPRSWPVKRKTSTWITKPSPGAHALEESIPVTVVMRDMLGLAGTAKEVRLMLQKKMLKIDGKTVRSPKQGMGLMDVLGLPTINSYYRMVLDKRGKLQMVKISEEEAGWKLSRIDDKKTIAGGKTQLNLHDGRNIVLDANQYKTGDVLKITIPEQKILASYSLEKGNTALITSGANVGNVAVVEEYEITRLPSENLVKFTDGKYTTKCNVFIVGNKTSEIALPEEAVL